MDDGQQRETLVTPSRHFHARARGVRVVPFGRSNLQLVVPRPRARGELQLLAGFDSVIVAGGRWCSGPYPLPPPTGFAPFDRVVARQGVGLLARLHERQLLADYPKPCAVSAHRAWQHEAGWVAFDTIVFPGPAGA